MILVNLAASLVLIVGLVFYRFVYPKKKINLFILLILISLLPLISLLRPGDYESGDFNIHIYRIISFYESLKEGIIMPSWSAELNAMYGVPVFIFNYPLPYYFISFFHWLGFTFIAGTKLFLGLTYFFSGIFMYLWINKLTNNKLSAFTAGIFYLFAPYHLIDTHFRATLGECLIYMLAPLIFFFITKYSLEKQFIYLVLITLLTFLLFLAHPLLAVVFWGLAILYVVYLSLAKKDIKILFTFLFSLLIGFASSLYVWLPYLLYSPYTYNADPVSTIVFYPFSHLFYSPWMFGFLFQGHHGELEEIIGYTQIFILAFSLVMIGLRRIPKKIQIYYAFWTGLCVIILLLMHPAFKFLWDFTPGAESMLMPYGRLSLAISFCISVLAAYFVLAFLLAQTKRKLIYILILVTIGSTILNWGQRRVIPEIGDAYLLEHAWAGVGITPSFMNSKWTKTPSFWFPKRPGSPLAVLDGKASVKQLTRTSTKHVYVLSAETPIVIRENTLYFPGWSLKSNNSSIPLYPDQNGVINAKLPAGVQYLELTYEDIPLYKLSKMISAGLFLTMLLLLIFSRFVQHLLTKVSWLLKRGRYRWFVLRQQA